MVKKQKNDHVVLFFCEIGWSHVYVCMCVSKSAIVNVSWVCTFLEDSRRRQISTNSKSEFELDKTMGSYSNKNQALFNPFDPSHNVQSKSENLRNFQFMDLFPRDTRCGRCYQPHVRFGLYKMIINMVLSTWFWK